ncbi:MAG: Crp/Fnr family transcriptional regulator [Xenococcaceae cyanobacterium]
MQTTLTANWMLRSFNRHDTIPLRTDSLWLLKGGVVKTQTWNEEGTAVTLGYWGSGDVVGKPLSQISPYEIKCVTRVEASCISLNHWNCHSDAILRYIQQTEELLYLVRSEPMRQRLLKILIWLARKFGREVEQGQLIELRLTHQELAEVTGTTRVTVTRLLNQFVQEGIISRPCSHSIIVSRCF